MTRRRGTRNMSGESRQLGSSDRRGRRNAQISSVHGGTSESIKSTRGNMEVRVGKTLNSTSDGVEINPANAVADATSSGDVQVQLNALLATLRAAGMIKE